MKFTISHHFLLIVGTLTNVLANPIPSTHSPKRLLATRDLSAYTDGLATITTDVNDLDARILTYHGDDIANITTGAAALITALLAETKAIQSYFLNATEAATLLDPLETFAGRFTVVVEEYVGIHDAVAAAGEGWYLYSQLQEEHTAALTYTGNVVARIPAGDIKVAADAWATNITDTLQAGVVAYKDIAVRPTELPRA
ncbi:uncharacterized protein BO97DRAFT_428476 [Aspergillus homomorphus CBS 101889]|uniref:Hydrophobic surface binding protein A n=1 Tax=Aspergillus homomorphus (strain CBS 101889) TaxID=1450537 RepID=A0A395HKI6_ASPHC|nr:hypothetical protein BO97DRAFT_428476 [Aspergillus homomorphus CBS 101889]RAL08337.1 hypothetical protein BO97DRAFT_428476 [Aspergillus homomorphus CBS 101889]